MITVESAASATLEAPPEESTECLPQVDASFESFLPSATGSMTMIQYLRAVQELLGQGRLRTLTPEETRANRKQAREAAHASIARAEDKWKGFTS